MQNLWDAISNVVLDLKTDQVVTLVLIALFVSTATAGLFRLMSRVKVDPTALLTGLILGSSLLSMLAAGAYVRSTIPTRGAGGFGRPPGGNRPATAVVGASDALATRLLMEFDTNRDGRLSAEEAARAASHVVTQASASHGDADSLDITELRRELRRQLAPMPHVR
jgi:hypothetical protein